MESVSYDHAMQTIQCKHGLYTALQYNQYILPPRNDALLSTKFLLGIIKGSYWMLHSNQITTIKVCAYPPKKEELAQIVYDTILQQNNVAADIKESLKRTGKLIRKKKPHKDWMLLVLSQLDPNHRIFSKGHTKALAKKKRIVDEIQVPNPNGFFDGL